MELQTFLKENPSYIQPAYDALSFCTTEQSFEDTVSLLNDGTYPKTFVVPPDAFVAMLRDRGLLSMTTYVNGKPYEGSHEDLLDDESIDDNAVITCTLIATEEGAETTDEISPTNRLSQLFGIDPDDDRVYLRILELTDSPKGLSRAELEKVLHDEGLIPHDPRTGLISVFPTYYIDNLERASGLVWGSSWKTTDEGRRIYQQQNHQSV